MDNNKLFRIDWESNDNHKRMEKTTCYVRKDEGEIIPLIIKDKLVNDGFLHIEVEGHEYKILAKNLKDCVRNLIDCNNEFQSYSKRTLAEELKTRGLIV